MKNNWDLENIVFNTTGREYQRFIYDDIGFLLIMVIAN